MKMSTIQSYMILRMPIAFATLLMCLSLASPAGALDLRIESEADYQATLDGIRAAEYVRQHYLEGQTVPRALVTSTALWAFAERNPLVEPDQLVLFVSRFDAQMMSVVPGDPDLASNGAVLAALSTARIADSQGLEGTDTRVGRRSLELLGMELDGLVNYEGSRQRMSRFDRAAVQRLIHRRETADMLAALLSGRTPDGEHRRMLAETADAYLASQGLNPMLGMIDPGQVEINAGLDALPSYTDFLALRDTPDAHQTLEAAVFADIDTIQAQAADLLQDIGTPAPELGQFVDSLALSRAAADPSDPEHAAALAFIEARRLAIIQSARAIAAQRSAVFARTLLLQQSNFPDVQSIATSARSFASLQLQTNNTLAIAKESVGIAGSMIGIVAGLKTGNLWGAAQSMTDLVGGALGLGDLLGGGPSAEQQIFDQIVALRQQVEDLRVQMNARFDVVDAKLDQVFETMVFGFQQLGSQIGDLQQDVDTIAAEISEARSSLDRIEDALFGFSQELLLADLSQQTNLVLNYFGNNGVSLPYANTTPSFVGSSSFFYTFATSTSKGMSFAGTPDDQPLVLTVDNAAAVLDSGAIARSLNDLRRVPAGLGISGPLTPGRVPAPAPWSQGAAAYLQLAHENPWYFNYQFATQSASGGPTRIDEIIENGERITGLANAVRSNESLFDAILDRAAQTINDFQSALLDWIEAAVLDRYSNPSGSVRLDPWGPLVQNITELAPVGRLEVRDSASSRVIFERPSLGQTALHGWELAAGPTLSAGYPADITRAMIARRNALHFVAGAAGGASKQVDAWIDKRTIVGPAPEVGRFTAYISNHANSPHPTTRVVKFSIQIRITTGFQIVWIPLPEVVPGPYSNFYIDHFREAFDSGLDDALAGDELIGQTFPSGSVRLLNGGNVLQFTTRIVVTEDLTHPARRGALHLPDFQGHSEYLGDLLAGVRGELRGQFLSELAMIPNPEISGILLRLDNDLALLDAYLTIGMADALNLSEALRSGVRGGPSIGGLGFGRDDIERLILHMQLIDDGQIGGNPELNLINLVPTLQDRIQALAGEIDLAADSTAPSYPYVEMILAELRALRGEARRIAIGDTFELNDNTLGVLIVAAEEGLVRNDVLQAGTVGDQVVVDMDFFDSPDALLPTKGQITIEEDGSFSYVADVGADGIDRFSYRLKAPINLNGSSTADAFSEPTVVVVRLGDGFDPDRIFRDSFE